MIANVHLPQSSFSLSLSPSDTLPTLFSRVADKASLPSGEQIGGRKGKEGWRLRYAFQGREFSLDDEDDFQIFLQRFPHSSNSEPDFHLLSPPSVQTFSTSSTLPPKSTSSNPSKPKQAASQHGRKGINEGVYEGSLGLGGALNTSPNAPAAHHIPSTHNAPRDLLLHPTHGLGNVAAAQHHATIKVPASLKATQKHRKEFEEFHSNKGVRTVQGDIGPTKGVRMLLKAGYRHVYISRAFAQANGFIPADAAPGWYGYGGLVNLGSWPIKVGSYTSSHTVMLSEEVHFPVVLGRSWMEKMGVKTDGLDETFVTLRPKGLEEERVEVDLVVVRDGKGEVITVT